MANTVFTISVATEDGSANFSLQVGSSMTIETLKIVIGAEINVPSSQQIIVHEGRMLNNSGLTLQAAGLKAGDLVFVRRGAQAPPAPPAPQASAQQAAPVQNTASTAAMTADNVPVSNDLRFEDLPPNLAPDVLRAVILKNGHLLKQLEHVNPEMAKAINDPDPNALRAHLIKQQMQRYMGQRAENMEIDRLNQDPFSLEAQRAIEDRIRNEQVEQNRQLAMEHSPESFTRVLMLYVPVEVGGTNIQAFVDSGAQTTIMSKSCAEKCGVMRLLDTRFAGQAVGVGTAKILGKVHLAQIKFGETYLQCSFTVLDEKLGDKNMEFLLGLDMLKRYQCSIDLKENVLRLHAGGAPVEVKFLSEGELPQSKGGTQAAPGAGDLKLPSQ
jgi:DNA damage-inducible protein 1